MFWGGGRTFFSPPTPFEDSKVEILTIWPQIGLIWSVRVALRGGCWSERSAPPSDSFFRCIRIFDNRVWTSRWVTDCANGLRRPLGCFRCTAPRWHKGNLVRNCWGHLSPRPKMIGYSLEMGNNAKGYKKMVSKTTDRRYVAILRYWFDLSQWTQMGH